MLFPLNYNANFLLHYCGRLCGNAINPSRLNQSCDLTESSFVFPLQSIQPQLWCCLPSADLNTRACAPRWIKSVCAWLRLERWESIEQVIRFRLLYRPLSREKRRFVSVGPLVRKATRTNTFNVPHLMSSLPEGTRVVKTESRWLFCPLPPPAAWLFCCTFKRQRATEPGWRSHRAAVGLRANGIDGPH